ncbi:MAG: undecaprenyl-diphosphatase UppP [Proteobacteria bacterium]|nr:undecaprenyl-diphosphatase UppP [Pseudomonadota bacterium]MDP2107211.1 undecaprenyl-diphosphatase UppP [Desulfobulbaceae bacterium]
MEFVKAILLGLLQGATEFLPVSSSGHLVLAEAFFHIQEASMAFDVALHMGTLLAILVYFRKEFLALFRAMLRPDRSDETVCANQHLALLLFVATIPAAVLGKLFGDQIEANLRQPAVVASTLAGLGLILLWAEKIGRRGRSFHELTLVDAIIIGLAQACALVPGVSRSGITMTVGLFRNLDRPTAARFSFLMSAPIVAGAGLLHLVKIIKEGFPPGQEAFFLYGFLASAISGYLFIAFLMRYIQTRSFAVFAYYRIVLAGVVVWTMFR